MLAIAVTRSAGQASRSVGFGSYPDLGSSLFSRRIYGRGLANEITPSAPRPERRPAGLLGGLRVHDLDVCRRSPRYALASRPSMSTPGRRLRPCRAIWRHL